MCICHDKVVSNAPLLILDSTWVTERENAYSWTCSFLEFPPNVVTFCWVAKWHDHTEVPWIERYRSHTDEEMPMVGAVDRYHRTVVDDSLLDNCCTPVVAQEGRCNTMAVADRKMAPLHVEMFDSHHNDTTAETHPFDTPWFLPVEVNHQQSFPN